MSTWSCGLQLRITGGPGKGLTHPIDSKQFSIGRARTTDDRQAGWFRLNDDAVCDCMPNSCGTMPKSSSS